MINKNFPLYSLVSLFCLALSSCAGLASPPATATPTFTPTILPSPTPTPTPLPPTGLITFDSNREGGWGIFAINADGSGEANMVTISPGGGDEYSSWSPDGQNIAFHSYRSGTTADIYIINADSTGLTRITDDPAYEMKPMWSPDGNQIAFLSSENGNPPYEIYLMNADGSGLQRLTGDANGMTPPSWSPDGSRIAFESYSGENLEVFTINVDGSDLVQLTEDSASAEPAWSPDGERIAFVSARNGDSDIYVMNVDGSGVTQLTTNFTCFEPVWSPDGNYIAFTSQHGGNPDIYIMRSDGSGVTQLTDDPADDYSPRFAPAGVTLSSDPWFGPPFCMLDKDGDLQPDQATTSFPAPGMGYVMFPYRNMTDGMLFGHQWTYSDSDLNPLFMSPWDGGDSGWHTSYSYINEGSGTVSIKLTIDGQVVQEVVCSIGE